MKIGIVGLGLMGGSLGLSMREVFQNAYILGLDHNELHQKKALELGIVDHLVSDINDLHDVDILILSTPVDSIISILNKLENIKKNMTIIDLGSTKAKIVSSVPQNIRSNFIAAHPMTGTEKSGPTSAVNDLYKDKVVVLCNMEESGQLQQKVAISLFEELGMNVVYMDAKEHDKHIAYISHLPHALSFALANCVISQEDPKSITALAGGGFKDMSRIAKSSPQMWEDVFRQNADHITKTIELFSNELQACKNLIEEQKWDELNAWMSNANTLHKIL